MGTRPGSPALSWLVFSGVSGGIAMGLSLLALGVTGPCIDEGSFPGVLLAPGLFLVETLDLRGGYGLAAILLGNGLAYGFTLGTPLWILKRSLSSNQRSST